VLLIVLFKKKKKTTKQNIENGKSNTQSTTSASNKEDPKNATEPDGIELTVIKASQNGYLPTESSRERNDDFNDSFL
jgi:hypothetical protein